MKLRDFLSHRKMKKADSLPRPDRDNLVSKLVADLDDKDSKPSFKPDDLPGAASSVLHKQDPRQMAYDMKVQQANASQGIKPKISGLKSFVQRKKGMNT